MDKNTLTGFILIAAVLIGFSYFSRPSEAEMEAQRRQDSIATVAQQKAQMAQEAKEEAEIAHQAQVALDTTSLFYAHRRGEAQNVVLENELIKLTFNTRGGTVQKVELKEYKNQQGGPVTLFDEKTYACNSCWVGRRRTSTPATSFSPQSTSATRPSPCVSRLPQEAHWISITSCCPIPTWSTLPSRPTVWAISSLRL